MLRDDARAAAGRRPRHPFRGELTFPDNTGFSLDTHYAITVQ